MAQERLEAQNRAYRVLYSSWNSTAVGAMVLAHRDPGVPNWIDTEGKGFGMMFWRFFLPDGEVETPQATVVKFADVEHADLT